MTEPATTSAGGLALWKIGTGILGMGIVASALGFIVLPPKTPKEYATRALATMIASAVFGPVLVFAAFQHYPSLFVAGQTMAVSLGMDPFVGTFMTSAPLLAMAGIPAWWILGAIFLWFERHQGHDIVELAVDAKADLNKLKGGD